jgi:uridine phosphorylase
MAYPDLTSPISAAKNHAASSVFRPENLLREARRQKGLPAARVPEICLLDPDGDLARHLVRAGNAARDPNWPCYHTDLYRFGGAEGTYCVVPCAVGAPFAVLIAEQLFASGCRLLISITSAGQIAQVSPPPYFVLIERALRDEGTSQHYLPPAQFAEAPAHLIAPIADALQGFIPPVFRGAAWTTDAPFRETEPAIADARAAGALAVEMEAAGLYAFAKARGHDVLCFAHVTNQLARIEGDFEKGEADGAVDALRILDRTARAWRATRD